jgi:hypothetical protein
MLQYSLNHGSTPAFHVDMADLNSFTTQGFGLHLKTSVEPFKMYIPFFSYIGMGDLWVHVYDNQDNILFEQFISGTQFYGNLQMNYPR